MARERVYSVDSVVYQVFYDILRNVFIADCYKDIPEKAVNADSPYLWDDTNPATGKPFALKFFVGTNISDTRYFYRRYIDLDPVHKKSGSINIHAFVNGLEYIGVKPTVKEYERLKKPSDKIDYLYQEFLQQYAEEIQAEEDRSERKYEKLPKNIENNFLQSSDLIVAITTVHTFYDNINAGSYREAWNILSPIKQNKEPWFGDFEKFRIGYKNTSNLHNIVVLHTNQPRPNIVECKIFYDDEINAYTSQELYQFGILTVNDIDAFADQVKKLQKGFEDKGLKGFEKIELHKLFDPDASEYIWYKANFPSDKLNEIFPIRKPVTVRRVHECTCMYIKNSWLIHEIKSVKSYSVR